MLLLVPDIYKINFLMIANIAIKYTSLCVCVPVLACVIYLLFQDTI